LDLDIERKEAYAIVSFLIFGLLWVIIVMPILQVSPWFYNLNPIIAYPAYYLGLILVFTFGLGGVIGYLQHRELNLVSTLKSGLGTWTGFSFVADMVAGGFYLAPSGSVLIALNTSSLETSAVDAFVATIYRAILGNVVDVQMQLFGMTYSVWYILTYPVTIGIALVVMALLLPTKEFFRALADNLGF
jgi:hypothetical protein